MAFMQNHYEANDSERYESDTALVGIKDTTRAIKKNYFLFSHSKQKNIHSIAPKGVTTQSKKWKRVEVDFLGGEFKFLLNRW